MTARLTRASAPALAGALVCAALTGCSGDSAKEAKTTSTSVATSSPSPPSTTTSSTTGPATTASNSTYAGAPGVPEAAKYKTDAGAIAFAKYYLETVNKVGQQPKVGVLEPLALPSCKTCKNYENNVAWLKSNGYHDSGATATVRGVSMAAADTVRVAVTQNATSVVDRNGRVIRSNKRLNGNLLFELAWTPDGWRARTIKSESSDA